MKLITEEGKKEIEEQKIQIKLCMDACEAPTLVSEYPNFIFIKHEIWRTNRIFDMMKEKSKCASAVCKVLKNFEVSKSVNSIFMISDALVELAENYVLDRVSVDVLIKYAENLAEDLMNDVFRGLDNFVRTVRDDRLKKPKPFCLNG